MEQMGLPYSPLMPASAINFAHLAFSEPMNWRKLSAVVGAGSAPSALIFSATLGSLSALTKAALSVATTADGVRQARRGRTSRRTLIFQPALRQCGHLGQRRDPLC